MSPLIQLMRLDSAITFLLQAVHRWRGAADVHRNFLVRVAIGIAVIAGMAAGCSAKEKSPAVGSWRCEDDAETVEFRSDGTLRGIDKYGRPLTGSFEFVDGDHVRIKMTTSSVAGQGRVKMVDNAEGVCRLDVQGDLLTLTEENGTASHYRRAK